MHPGSLQIPRSRNFRVAGHSHFVTCRRVEILMQPQTCAGIPSYPHPPSTDTNHSFHICQRQVFHSRLQCRSPPFLSLQCALRSQPGEPLAGGGQMGAERGWDRGSSTPSGGQDDGRWAASSAPQAPASSLLIPGSSDCSGLESPEAIPCLWTTLV